MLLKMHRDIMAELETERRVTRSVLEGSPVCIVRLVLSLIVLSSIVNSEMLDIGKREPITGRSLADIAPRLDMSPFHQVLQSGKPYRQDTLSS